MSLQDSRGCPVSSRNAASLAQFEQALGLSVSYRFDPLATIQATLEADPGFAMGHCLRAGLLIMATDRTGEPLLARVSKPSNRWVAGLTIVSVPMLRLRAPGCKGISPARCSATVRYCWTIRATCWHCRWRT